MPAAAVVILATSLSSPHLGTFFGLPGWMGPHDVPSARTYGSPDALNATHRVDTTALRGVSAVFEGWAERCYYVHAGPSNEWDVAKYGPADPLNFRFESDIYPPAFVWQPDTNRVANCGTRRFVEYGHLSRLAEAVAWPDARCNLSEATRVWRPGWRHPYGSYYGSPMWSSTLFDLHSESPLPVFGWSRPGTGLSLREWGESAITWDNVAPSVRPGEFDWGVSYDYTTVLAADMLRDVWWGETDPDRYCPDRWELPEGETTETIVSGPYDLPVIRHEVRRCPVEFGASEVLFGSPSPAVIGGSLDTAVRAALESLFPTGGFRGTLLGVVTVERGPDMSIGRDVAVSVTFGRMKLTDSDRHVYSAGPFPLGVDTILTDILADPDSQYSVVATGASDPCPLNLEFSVYVAELPHSIVVSYPHPVGKPAASTFNVAYVETEVLVTNNVCKVHGVGTNATRRLVTDQIAGLGQCLSALDRTYARMEASVDSATERNFARTIFYESEPMDVTASYFEGDTGYADSEIMFHGFSAVRTATNDSVRALGGRHHVYAGVSYTTTGCGGDVVGSGDGGYVTAGSYEDLLRAVTDGGLRPLNEGRTVRVLITTMGVSAAYGVEVRAYVVDGDRWSPTMSGWLRPTSMTIKDAVCTAYYERSYSYERTNLASYGLRGDEDDRQILYPGSFDRVREATLWHVDSVLFEEGGGPSNTLMSVMYVDSLDSSPADRYSWRVDQRANKSTYGSHSALDYLLRAVFSDLAETCDRLVSQSVGVPDYQSPADMIPMDAGDLSLDGRFGLCRVNGRVPVFRLIGPEAEYTVRFPSDSSPDAGKMFLLTDSGEREVTSDELRGYVSLHTSPAGWGENVPPDQRRPACRDSYGARANAKVSGLSRVDWAWGALRRGD